MIAAAKTTGNASEKLASRGTTRATAASPTCTVSATANAGAAINSAARTIVTGSAAANAAQAPDATTPPGATEPKLSANARTTGTYPSSRKKPARNTDDHSRPKACAEVTFAFGTLPRTPT